MSVPQCITVNTLNVTSELLRDFSGKLLILKYFTLISNAITFLSNDARFPNTVFTASPFEKFCPQRCPNKVVF